MSDFKLLRVGGAKKKLSVSLTLLSQRGGVEKNLWSGGVEWMFVTPSQN